MTRRSCRIAPSLVCLLAAAAIPSAADRQSEAAVRLVNDAWAAWERGDIPIAHELASRFVAVAEDPAQGLHLLVYCAFVTGDYEGAIRFHKRIARAYERYDEIDKLLVQAYLHLNRYADAARVARERGMEKRLSDYLARWADRPLTVTLGGLTEVPFAKHPLTEYFPAFRVELEGQEVVAHLDTGGTFLVMGPDRAEALGINVAPAGEGYHGSQRVELAQGFARRFQIGGAVLTNVPVVVVPTLTGPQDFVIFGTNVLEQFLSTLDYQGRRLLLSPRKHPALTQKHLAMLPMGRVEIPFYLWGDHYMFARGSVGHHKGLNFFIDSGLVSLHPDGAGGLRQAAFTTSSERFIEWEFPPEEVEKRVFVAPSALALGPLEQTGVLCVASNSASWASFGGVRIDGLLSHAFLKHYTWTLDFERGRYLFSGTGSE